MGNLQIYGLIIYSAISPNLTINEASIGSPMKVYAVEELANRGEASLMTKKINNFTTLSQEKGGGGGANVSKTSSFKLKTLELVVARYIRASRSSRHSTNLMTLPLFRLIAGEANLP